MWSFQRFVGHTDKVLRARTQHPFQYSPTGNASSVNFSKGISSFMLCIMKENIGYPIGYFVSKIMNVRPNGGYKN